MNSKGQEFAGYKMMIGAIIALFVLIIIVSAVSYFDELRTTISSNLILDGVKAAYKSPNGDVIKKTNVTFKEGSYSKRFFGASIELDEQCIELKAARISGIELSSNESAVIVKANLVNDFYAKCLQGAECKSSCKTCCTFSIGEELERN
ncbi:MAG TPA: hypothetical protein VJK05_04150 [archaeon]|nr:hypothetical protein [archaeon]